MLPDNFDFAMIPPGMDLHLSEIGMLSSDIENIDTAIYSWVKDDLKLSAYTNEGFKEVPVLWQVPERAYQIKHNKDLRDAGGALKLPLLSIERTGVTKDPARKGSYQAQKYSTDHNGRTGRMVLARQIVEDKTRNFAVASGTRSVLTGSSIQQWAPRAPARINKKIVIKILSIPIPIYINVEYKILIKTEYQQQMNDIIAPFMTRTGQINAFIMRRNGHLYEGFIDQGFTHTNNVANLDEDLRMYSSEITIRVLGYLIGEGKNDDRPIVKVEENIVEITFPQEGLIEPDENGFYTFTS